MLFQNFRPTSAVISLECVVMQVSQVSVCFAEMCGVRIQFGSNWSKTRDAIQYDMVHCFVEISKTFITRRLSTMQKKSSTRNVPPSCEPKLFGRYIGVVVIAIKRNQYLIFLWNENSAGDLLVVKHFHCGVRNVHSIMDKDMCLCVRVSWLIVCVYITCHCL